MKPLSDYNLAELSGNLLTPDNVKHHASPIGKRKLVPIEDPDRDQDYYHLWNLSEDFSWATKAWKQLGKGLPSPEQSAFSKSKYDWERRILRIIMSYNVRDQRTGKDIAIIPASKKSKTNKWKLEVINTPDQLDWAIDKMAKAKEKYPFKSFYNVRRKDQRWKHKLRAIIIFDDGTYNVVASTPNIFFRKGLRMTDSEIKTMERHRATKDMRRNLDRKMKIWYDMHCGY